MEPVEVGLVAHVEQNQRDLVVVHQVEKFSGIDVNRSRGEFGVERFVLPVDASFDRRLPKKDGNHGHTDGEPHTATAQSSSPGR